MTARRVRFPSQGHVLDHLARTARAWSATPRIRRVAMDATRSRYPWPRNPRELAGALLEWTGENIAFVPDVRDLETLQSPRATLEFGGGDCDDHAALLASMMLATGNRTRLVASGFAGRLHHVFPAVVLGGHVTPADSTLPDCELGAFPPGHDSFHVTGDL